MAFRLEPEPELESESEPESEPEPVMAKAVWERGDTPYDGLHDIRNTGKWDYTQTAMGRWMAENKRLDEIAGRRYDLWEKGTRWLCLEPNCDWSTEVDIDDFTGQEIKPEMCGREGCGGKRLERLESVSVFFACLFPFLIVSFLEDSLLTRWINRTI